MRIPAQNTAPDRRCGGPDMAPDILFWATAFVAVFFSGLAKGGFAGVGMIATPLLSLVVPPLQAASIILPILLVQDLLACVVYRSNVDWQVLRPLLPGAVAGVAAGFLFAARVPDYGLALGLGLITLAFALRGLLRRSMQHPPPRKPDGRLAFLAGSAAGLTSMISHAGAPPFQIYVLRLRLARDTFVGCSVFFFCFLNLIKVPPFLMLGSYDLEMFQIIMLLLPWALISSRIGVALVRRTDPVRFERIILVLMGIIGVMLLREGFLGLYC